MPDTTNTNEGHQKLLGNWLKEWAGIISAVSNTTKLLGLVVLVAATAIVIAMVMTPAGDRNFSIYLYVLLGLLLLTIAGIFIDRQAERKAGGQRETTVVLTDEKKLEIEERRRNMPPVPPPNFTDNRAGFSIYHPEQAGWAKPGFLSYKEYLILVGVAANEGEADQVLQRLGALFQFGNMLAHSGNVVFQYGKPIKVEVEEHSTTADIESALDRLRKYWESNGQAFDEQTIQEQRQAMVSGGLNGIALNFMTSLHVQVYQKTDATPAISLPDLFMALSNSSKEPISQLTASNDSIVWVCRMRLINARVDGASSNFTVYRVYKLIERTDRFFMLQVQWSPESDSAIEVWEELKKMADSFKPVG